MNGLATSVHGLATFPMLQTALPANWSGRQSALHPIGPAAGKVSAFWWLIFTIATVVYVAVMIALAIAIVRHRREAREHTEHLPPKVKRHPATERRLTLVVGAAVGITVVILLSYLITDFHLSRALAAPLTDRSAMQISVIGHQWWWEIQYDDSAPQHIVSTANELHVPVGRAVLVRGTSRDVIHSLWMPNLNGKADLIAGYDNRLWFRADTPGVYRGQCAEFCGLEHAKMALVIVAEPVSQFNAWYAQQLGNARDPITTEERAGERVFQANQCASCHTIRGTEAGGRLGPELTHVGSQMTLAAGTLPNTSENLRRWITQPQAIKPGNSMPTAPLSKDEIDALVAYLEHLQ